MSLEEIFKSKGQASYCMYLRIKKSALQNEISEIEKNIAPLRNKQGASNYTYTYTDADKKILNSTNLKLAEMYKEIDVYNAKLNENNCGKYTDNISTCKYIDERIKSKSDLISELSKGVLAGRNNPKDLQQLNKELLNQQNDFTKYNCRDLIEYERLAESGLLLTEKSAEQEKNVLPSGYKEQYIYIGLGAVVVLASLYIISKK
jgi:hypothetical protein